MLALILLVTIGAAQAPAGRAPPVTEVAWIAGCWDSTRNGQHVTEHWMAPEGGTMMGVSRTTAGGTTTEWEFLIIRQGARGLEYVAKPSGQPEATFTAMRASANEVVFENPAHDFPQRVIYESPDNDTLDARIEGLRNGQLRTIRFPMKRVPCPVGGAR